MKNILYFASALFALTACDKGNGPAAPGDTSEGYIDASSATTWNYYSLQTGKIVGSADESVDNAAAWAARVDWDFAVQRYKIRTNSGASSTAGALGGVYAFDAANLDAYGNINVTTAFSSVQSVPNVEFVADAAVTMAGHGGDAVAVLSKAVVVQMWKNAAGTIMPPDYRPSPVYIFRTADGKRYYKVKFTQYKNEINAAGHVKFDAAQIYK